MKSPVSDQKIKVEHKSNNLSNQKLKPPINNQKPNSNSAQKISPIVPAQTPKPPPIKQQLL